MKVRGRFNPGAPVLLGALGALCACSLPPGPIAPDPPPSATIERRLRRLSAREYNNVVRDLLGDETRPADEFIAEEHQNGFDNGSAGLVVEGDQAVDYQYAAESLAERAVADLPRLLRGCDPVADGVSACWQRFLAWFPPRAYRRPLTGTELGRLQGIYETGVQDGGFALGLQLAIETVLQSPQFLYREELGPAPDDIQSTPPTLPPGIVRLTRDEIATELAFLITGSLPDETLLAALAGNRFEGTDDYRREAARLLATPAARETTRQFLHQWLGTDRLGAVAKDPRYYPSFNRDLATSMSRELDRDFEQVVWYGTGSLRELFTSPSSYADSALAEVYGMTVTDPGFVPVTLDPAHRKGVMTRAGFLTVHASADSSGPVARGVFVLDAILCFHIASPPPDVPAPASTQSTIDEGRTTRERFEIHSTAERCRGCHQAIDGIGFGFEEFDAIGASRTVENSVPIDASGKLLAAGDANGPFVGVSDLSERLMASQPFVDCFVKQMSRFAMGGTDVDWRLLATLGDGFSVDANVTDLLLALVSDPAFVLRTTTRPAPEVTP